MALVKRVIDSGISVFFQPILSVRARSLIGYEALARAVDPETGESVAPSLLFAAAAEEGNILELDRACRRAALDAFAPLCARTPSLLLFMNFESSIIDTPAAGSGHLLRSTKAAGVDPRNVVIEIVESRVRDVGAMRVFIESHRGEGFLIALDDMGAGHSNLDRIPLVRPDIMKVDRSLVDGIANEYYKRKVVEALSGLAHATGAMLLAEGVEREDDAVASLEAGADLFQGYLFSRPEPSGQTGCDCFARIESIARTCRDRAAESHAARRAAEHSFSCAVERLALSLPGAGACRSAETLRAWLSGIPDCECVYLLDGFGRQIGPTVCSGKFAAGNRQSSYLYHPAEEGADHSRKEYYYMAKGTGKVCITDPYISLATGSMCRTFSVRVGRPDAGEFIVCADFRSGR